jgi:hypothetical protein
LASAPDKAAKEGRVSTVSTGRSHKRGEARRTDLVIQRLQEPRNLLDLPPPLRLLLPTRCRNLIRQLGQSSHQNLHLSEELGVGVNGGVACSGGGEGGGSGWGEEETEDWR